MATDNTKEIINIHTNASLKLKESIKIISVRNFVEIQYIDNCKIQIPQYGRKLLPKNAILRIACFLEGSSIAQYIREMFLENYYLTSEEKKSDKIIHQVSNCSGINPKLFNGNKNFCDTMRSKKTIEKMLLMILSKDNIKNWLTVLSEEEILTLEKIVRNSAKKINLNDLLEVI